MLSDGEQRFKRKTLVRICEINYRSVINILGLMFCEKGREYTKTLSILTLGGYNEYSNIE